MISVKQKQQKANLTCRNEELGFVLNSMRRIYVRDIAESNLLMQKEVAQYLVTCVQKGQIQRALAIVDWNCIDDVDQVGVLLQDRE